MKLLLAEPNGCALHVLIFKKDDLLLLNVEDHKVRLYIKLLYVRMKLRIGASIHYVWRY